MTIREAARRAGVSERTVRNWIAVGIFVPACRSSAVGLAGTVRLGARKVMAPHAQRLTTDVGELALRAFLKTRDRMRRAALGVSPEEGL